MHPHHQHRKSKYPLPRYIRHRWFVGLSRRNHNLTPKCHVPFFFRQCCSTRTSNTYESQCCEYDHKCQFLPFSSFTFHFSVSPHHLTSLLFTPTSSHSNFIAGIQSVYVFPFASVNRVHVIVPPVTSLLGSWII